VVVGVFVVLRVFTLDVCACTYDCCGRHPQAKETILFAYYVIVDLGCFTIFAIEVFARHDVLFCVRCIYRRCFCNAWYFSFQFFRACFYCLFCRVTVYVHIGHAALLVRV